MTFAIFFILILGLFIGGLNLLPTIGDSGTAVTNGIILLTGWLKTWNFILPISEMILAIKIIIYYELILWGWHAIKGIIKWFRGHSAGE